jgi:hypothetical protein
VNSRKHTSSVFGTLLLISIVGACQLYAAAGIPAVGFGGAVWGMNPIAVKSAINPKQWQKAPSDSSFPATLAVTVYTSPLSVAGYPANASFYFAEDRFFQVTLAFDQSKLKNFDFNYNVFQSVNKFYSAIHDQTQGFVFDIFDLLEKKYGRKQPVFDGLDPRRMFLESDKYLNRERWNLRYYPYDFYKKIIVNAYARWNFPKTVVIFSLAIDAPNKIFDYSLSLTSTDFAVYLNKKKDLLRMQNL